jgi:hypothetical protein
VSEAGPPVERFDPRLTLAATVHCLTGCAIGEVIGMALGTVLAWHNATTVLVSIVLSFVFGYGLTMRSLLAAQVSFGAAARLALASDSLSIAVMEVIDNLFMLVVPGAMNARLDQPLFWLSLAGSLVLAGIVAFPVNGWLIMRGRGHALVHGGSGEHGGHGGHVAPEARRHSD